MSIEVIALYIAEKILGRLISQETWTKRVLQKLFPPAKYKDRLCKCIYETIDEHERKNRTNYPINIFPFYHSQILFDLLSQYMLFDNSSVELIEKEFEKNQNIIKPQKKELEDFYRLFLEKVDADEILKTKFIDEKYKEKIFANATKIDFALKKLEVIESNTKKILDKLDRANYHKRPGKELTALLPLLATDKIVKRDGDLDDIHDRLLKNKQILLVNGMGGIGKTTLAQLYITKYYKVYKYLIWITVNTNDFISDFNQTPGLKESLHITPEDKSPQEFFISIITALKNLSHKDNEQSLMVIDNIEADFLSYCNYLPHPPHWHILATSRHKLGDFDTKELGFLNEKQSVALFKLYYKQITISDKQIKKIVKELEYHTLTIEILAKTAQNDGLDVQKIVNTIAENYPVEVETRHALGKIDKITSYLSSIFDLSKLRDEEIWLLKQFYFLPPQLHTFHVIQTILLPATNEKQINLQRVLSKLVAKGWLLYNDSTNEYKLHRIIGDVIKYSTEIAFNDIALLIDSVSSLLKIDQTKDNPVNKFQWVIFGNYILSQLSEYQDNSISILQSNLAMVLQAMGDYQGAKGLLEKALISTEKNFGKKHPNTIHNYSILATVLQTNGDYQGAKELFGKVLISTEKNFGKNHPNTAHSYSNLAIVLQDLGDYQGAKKLLEKALISTEKNFGKEHPNTATCYSNLAVVIQALGDYQGAKMLFEKVIISDEKNFGKEHPNTARSYSNLAMVLKDIGDYQGAKDLLKKALISDEKNFGKEHPITAVSYSNLSLVLKGLGDYQGAKDLLKKALITYEKKFGIEHPRTARSYSYLALIYQVLGDYQGAKMLFEKVLISDEKNFGKEHPNTARSYSNLAMVLKDIGDYQGAKDLFEKAVLIFKNNLGDQHPDTITVRQNLEYLRKKMLNKNRYNTLSK